MRLRFSVCAEEDLIEIYDYGLANFGAEQAESYYAELGRVFEMLSRYPFVAKKRTEFRPSVRVHFHAAHAIVYTIEGDQLLVVRVLGNRQNWEAILRAE